jgi:hypothetical protein
MVGINGITGTLGTNAKMGLNGRMWTVNTVPAANQLTLQQDATGLAWSSGGTVYGPSTPPGLSIQDGVPVRSSDLTRRFLGAAMMLDSAQSGTFNFQNTAVQRLLWNYYNRISGYMRRVDSTASWTYNGTGYRFANNDQQNRLEVLIGTTPEDTLSFIANCVWGSPTANDGTIAIGEDTYNMSTNVMGGQTGYPATANGFGAAYLDVLPAAAGYHYFSWIEASISGASIQFSSSQAGKARNSGLGGRILY